MSKEKPGRILLGKAHRSWSHSKCNVLFKKIQTNHLLPKCRDYFMRALIKMSLGTIIRHILSMIQLPRINEYNLAKLWMRHTVIYFGRNIWRKMKIVRYCSNYMIWAENMDCLHIIIKGKKPVKMT